jgi:RHS repeat-associated protein
VWDGQFDPFGNASSITGGATMNLRFPGQYFDAETGIAQNWNRDYDPTIGRYIESDPIGMVDGPNPYLYANDNPLSNYDWAGMAVATPQCIAFSNLWGCLLKCAKEYYKSEAAAAALIVAGAPLVPKPFVAPGSSPGTSIGSTIARKIPGRFPFGVRLPAPTFNQIARGVLPFTPEIGKFVGRAVPFLGWGFAIYDATRIGICTKRCLNAK